MEATRGKVEEERVSISLRQQPCTRSARERCTHLCGSRENRARLLRRTRAARIRRRLCEAAERKPGSEKPRNWVTEYLRPRKKRGGALRNEPILHLSAVIGAVFARPRRNPTVCGRLGLNSRSLRPRSESSAGDFSARLSGRRAGKPRIVALIDGHCTLGPG